LDHSTKAAELFLEGYNCAQAVAVAFCDVTGMDQETAAKLASSFGGGVGGLREVCGAVSGMFMVLGYLYGYDTPGDNEKKKQLYGRIQALADSFREENGSIICRELMTNPPLKENLPPEILQYCAKRPCVRFVITAAKQLDAFILQNPLEG